MQKVVFTETHIGCGGHVNIVLPRPEAVRDFYKDIAVLAFPRPVGTERIRDLDYKNLSGRIRNHLQPDTASVRDAAIVRSGDVIDITDAMNADGTLSWHAPEDEWVVLRIGHTTTGTENHPAVTGGRGLEIDKMSAAATDYYWKHGVEPILDYLGDYVGTTVVDCVTAMKSAPATGPRLSTRSSRIAAATVCGRFCRHMRAITSTVLSKPSVSCGITAAR